MGKRNAKHEGNYFEDKILILMESKEFNKKHWQIPLFESLIYWLIFLKTVLCLLIQGKYNNIVKIQVLQIIDDNK